MLIYLGSGVIFKKDWGEEEETNKEKCRGINISFVILFFFVGSLLVSSAFNCYSFTEEPQSGIVNILLLLSMYCKNKNNNKKKKKKKHDEVLAVFE